MSHRRIAGPAHQTGIGERTTPYKCIGIGVGPSNLSLAAFLHGHADTPALFLDRKPGFGWHDGQQVPGAGLQVSMFKDLVSLVDPTNPFSFTAYLTEMGRMYHFLNAGFDAVPRLEFRNYLAWAANRNPDVAFGEEVLEVEFDELFRVHTDRRSIWTENISVGVGTEPWTPPFALIDSIPSQFHVAEFMPRAGALAGKRVAVVGGGQSGAEAFLDLLSRPAAELPESVTWISRRPTFLPMDDSPFTNEFFMPCYSDHFAGLELDLRRAHNDRHILASDGVSESTLRAIYQALYQHHFLNEVAPQCPLRPHREVVAVDGIGGGAWRVSCTHLQTGEQEQIEVDVVIWATGFRPARVDFLKPLAHRFRRVGEEIQVDKDFAAVWDGPADRAVFVQNAARVQRGLADPNLSLVAWRGSRIADRIRGVSGRDPLAAFAAWTPVDERQRVIAP